MRLEGMLSYEEMGCYRTVERCVIVRCDCYLYYDVRVYYRKNTRYTTIRRIKAKG